MCKWQRSNLFIHLLVYSRTFAVSTIKTFVREFFVKIFYSVHIRLFLCLFAYEFTKFILRLFSWFRFAVVTALWSLKLPVYRLKSLFFEFAYKC